MGASTHPTTLKTPAERLAGVFIYTVWLGGAKAPSKALPRAPLAVPEHIPQAAKDRPFALAAARTGSAHDAVGEA